MTIDIHQKTAHATHLITHTHTHTHAKAKNEQLCSQVAPFRRAKISCEACQVLLIIHLL